MEEMSDKTDNQLDVMNRRIALATESVLSPCSMAADLMAVHSYDKAYVDVFAVEESLKKRVNAVVQGRDTSPLEEMLIAQAYGLNSVYQSMMMKAASPEIAPYPERVSACLNMAVKAQRQSLQAIELLGKLKNPPVPTLIQQNIAHTQQVNNRSLPPVQVSEDRLANELLSDHRAHATLDT